MHTPHDGKSFIKTSSLHDVVCLQKNMDEFYLINNKSSVYSKKCKSVQIYVK